MKEQEEKLNKAYNRWKFRKSVLGEKNRKTLKALDEYLDELWRQKEYARAFEARKEKYKIYRETYGEKDPKTINELNHLVDLLYKLEKFNEALALGEKVLALRQEVLGEVHPDTVSSITNLIVICEQLCEIRRKLKFEQMLYFVYKRSTEWTEERIDFTLDYVMDLSSVGQYERGMECLEEMAEMYRIKLGEDSDEYLFTLLNLALVLEISKKTWNIERAVEIRRKIYIIRKKKNGTVHKITIFALEGYVQVLLKLCRSIVTRKQYSEEAIKAAADLMLAQEAIEGKWHDSTLNALQQRIQAYELSGLYQQALFLQEEMLNRIQKRREEDPSCLAKLYYDTLVHRIELMNIAGTDDKFNDLFEETVKLLLREREMNGKRILKIRAIMQRRAG